MERWDIYDKDRNRTGRTMARDDWHMQPGEYHISVTAVIQAPDGRYLITQRKEDKPWGAGWWEFPGGGVNAGEEPADAAAREASEETGLDLSGVAGERIFGYVRENAEEQNNYFMDLYRFAIDFAETDVHVQEEEVAGFRLATADEIAQLGAQGIFMHYDSIKPIFAKAGAGLRAVDVASDAQARADVAQLMDEVFPEAERMPIDYLAEGAAAPTVSFKAFYEGDAFAGFAMWMWHDGITYLLYLAVSPKAQSRGIGTAILGTVKASRPGDRVFLEMESMDAEADNREQRKRRLRFYGRNGFRQTGLHSRDTGVLYDVLCARGTVSLDECRAFFARFPVVAVGEVEVFATPPSR